MSKVEVLCPNGYRVLVNVLPSTKVYKILEESCLKQGFLPINKYELKHGRKSLELSSTFDKSGLINNSKIELTPLKEEWKEGKVEVNLQTSDGKRIKKEFSPQNNLFEVLQSLEKDNQVELLKNSTLKPVLVYVNEQFVGDFELQNTTLKNLGLFKGRTLFRHMFREIENKTLLEIEEKIKKENTKYQKLLEVAKEKEKDNKERQKIEDDNKKLAQERSILATIEETTAEKTTKDVARNKEVNNRKNEIMNKEISNTQKETIKEQKTIKKDEKKTEVKKDNAENSQANPFNHFKFPEATKGKDVYKNELSDYKKEEFQACDRETLIYTLLEQMEVDYQDDIPDDFYDVTESDAALIQKRLQGKVRELAEQPLLTEEGRRRAREDLYGKYNRSVIRFQFASGHVIQAAFMIRESVNALYKFVKEALQDGIQFELYTSPPKLVLSDMTLNLIEANLVPMSIVYVSTPLLTDAASVVIKEEVLQKFTSTHAQAQLNVSKWLPQKEETKEENKETDKKKKKKEVKDTSDSQNIKIPKWMQKGKK